MVLIEERADALEGNIEAPEGRAAIAADQGGRAQAGDPIPPMLVEREAHQRLNPRHHDVAVEGEILVLERDVSHGLQGTQPSGARDVEFGASFRRFAAIVDADLVGRGLSVTIFADLISNAPESVERFEALVLAMNGAVDVRRMFGRPDYIITVETRDLAGYEELYQTDLAQLRQVAHIESHIPMRVLRDRTSPP